MGGGWRGEEGDAGAGLFVAGGISPTAPNRECIGGSGSRSGTEQNGTEHI